MKKLFILIFLSLTSQITYSDIDKHYELAKRTVNLPDGEKLDQLIFNIVNEQIKINPTLTVYKNPFKTFYKEILSSAEYKKAMIGLQMELYTYEDLLELEKLINTPIH